MLPSSYLLLHSPSLTERLSSQGRRVVPPRWSRPGQTVTTVSTTSGSPSPPCGTPPAWAARPAPASGRLRLVLTLTSGPEELELRALENNQVLDTYRASHLDYLHSLGHCIWIHDITFPLDLDSTSCAPQSTKGPSPSPCLCPASPRPPSAPRPRHLAPAAG